MKARENKIREALRHAFEEVEESSPKKSRRDNLNFKKVDDIKCIDLSFGSKSYSGVLHHYVSDGGYVHYVVFDTGIIEMEGEGPTFEDAINNMVNAWNVDRERVQQERRREELQAHRRSYRR